MFRIFFLAVLIASSFAASAKSGPVFRNGPWRATLHRNDGSEIVFNFEVKDSAHKKFLTIRNAGERLPVDDIQLQQDSVIIRLPFFESQIRAVLTKDGNLSGVWLKHGADSYTSIPFNATYNVTARWATKKAPAANISGRWSASFSDGKSISLRVGEFVQKGAHVTGTFLDPTGDFRYLEGVVDGDSLKLSCFDGGHAYLFTAKIGSNGSISGGQYFAGAVNREDWTAKKDPNAKLPDEFSLTKWKKNAGPLQFSFRDLDGKTVTLRDPRFKNKIVIIQIMGSWCPNCMDETRFLSKFYDSYHGKGVEIVGLAYERSTDFTRSQNSLHSFQQRFQVKYPVLITGVTVGDPKRAEKTLPQLESIVGFPTTIFLDRKGVIAKIHTGFNGPGTGEHYAQEQKTFYRTVDGLLGE